MRERIMQVPRSRHVKNRRRGRLHSFPVFNMLQQNRHCSFENKKKTDFFLFLIAFTISVFQNVHFYFLFFFICLRIEWSYTNTRTKIFFLVSFPFWFFLSFVISIDSMFSKAIAFYHFISNNQFFLWCCSFNGIHVSNVFLFLFLFFFL